MRSAAGLWNEVDQASAYVVLPNLTEPRPNLAELTGVAFFFRTVLSLAESAATMVINRLLSREAHLAS